MVESDVTTLRQKRPYSHCAFTSAPGLGSAEGSRFVELLLAMDPGDPDPTVVGSLVPEDNIGSKGIDDIGEGSGRRRSSWRGSN